MTSFGWKRKVGEKVSVEKTSAFEAQAAEEGTEVASGDVDWITLQAPKRSRVIPLEDPQAKAERLTREGATLAEAERFWEAILKWDEALQFTPNSEKIYEMKAQAYMNLNELFPAVHAAEKAVELAPLWWVGHQTLGRAQLGLGEVSLAARSICRAAHLAPGEEELFKEDLPWVLGLLEQKQTLARKTKPSASTSTQEAPILVELSTDTGLKQTNRELQRRMPDAQPSSGDQIAEEVESSSSTLRRLPNDYVFMRS